MYQGIRNSNEVVIECTKERNHESKGHLAPEMQLSGSTTKSKDASSFYSSSSGIDNLTYHGQNFVDIPLAN